MDQAVSSKPYAVKVYSNGHCSHLVLAKIVDGRASPMNALLSI